MEIFNRWIHKGRNCLSRAGESPKGWLPYVAVLLLLGGIGVFWENPVEEQLNRDRGDQRSSGAVSSSFFAENEGGSKGRQVYNAAGVRRHRPLKDLFSPSEKSTGASVRQTAAYMPVKNDGVPSEAVIAMPGRQEELPQACGLIENSGHCLVILRNDKGARACAAGDTFGGCRIAYIQNGIAGLEKNGVITEIIVSK